MARASIVINQSGSSAGVASESRDDLDLSIAVSLTNDDNSGVDSIRWTLVNKPNGSSAVLTNAIQSRGAEVFNPVASTFVPDISGSYLIELTVNGSVKQRKIAAIKTVGPNKLRIPSLGEGNEFLGGWSRNVIDIIKTLDARLSVGLIGEETLTPWFEWNEEDLTQFEIINGYTMTDDVSVVEVAGTNWIKVGYSQDDSKYNYSSVDPETGFAPHDFWESNSIILKILEDPPSENYFITAEFLI